MGGLEFGAGIAAGSLEGGWLPDHRADRADELGERSARDTVSTRLYTQRPPSRQHWVDSRYRRP